MKLRIAVGPRPLDFLALLAPTESAHQRHVEQNEIAGQLGSDANIVRRRVSGGTKKAEAAKLLRAGVGSKL